jgi:hypothetical protein
VASTFEHIAAVGDSDLRQRLGAAAEMLGIPDAAGWVGQNLAALVAATVDINGGTSITATYAYAANVRREHLADSRAIAPGLNPGAVTDDILNAAIAAVRTP